MKKVLLTSALALVLGFGLVGCNKSATTDGGAHATASGKCAACAEGKSGKAVWCDTCNKGFVNSKTTSCKSCVVAANGGPACAACAKKKTN